MQKKVFLFVFSLFVMFACKREAPEKATGYLSLNISQGASLKSGLEVEDFILRINDGFSDVIKQRIGDLPEQIALTVGTYVIEAYSMEFSEPKFEMPFYTGKTTVEIEAGVTKKASLLCAQGNAGIKVVWSEEFPTRFTTYYAEITGKEGYLHYSSDEEDTGYFLPGTVTVFIMADGLNINGGTILLAARDMVTATMRPKQLPSGSLTVDISIDEEVNDREVDVIVDPDYIVPDPGSEKNPYNIAQARAHQNENAKWITGFIVGSKPSAGYDFVNGQWQSSNIVLADDIGETDDTKIIIVQLPTGAIRTALSLDNPANLHRKVNIKGNLMTYLSRSGLQSPTDYSFP